MTVRIVLMFICLAVTTASVTGAQTQPQSAAPAQAPATAQPPQRAATQTPPPAAAPASTPPRRLQAVNVRVELTIADKPSSAAEALRKTVTVVTADGIGAFIRSTANYSNLGAVPLNVDVEPFILEDGKVRLKANVQYDLPAMNQGAAGTDPTNLRRTQIQQNLTLILESGKAVVAAQSADPVGDRQVTIEVKATVLR